MSDAHPHTPSRNRAQIEAQCLLTSLIPMPDDTDRRIAAKVVAVILVTVWSVVTLSLTLEGVDAVSPPHYGLFTAGVWALVGKMWDLEVKKYFPGRDS